MNSYQLIYLINANLSEEELSSFPKKISDFILEEQGTLDKAEKPIRRKLAYPIKKKEEIFLAVLNFHLDSDKLKKLEKMLKSENEILRHMVLTNKAPKKNTSEKRSKRTPELAKKSDEPLKEITVKKKEDEENGDKESKKENKKEELEKIDKKIEEILNTD